MTRRLTVTLGDRVLFDAEVDDEGVAYQMVQPTPLTFSDPAGPCTIELRASADPGKLDNYTDSWWKL